MVSSFVDSLFTVRVVTPVRITVSQRRSQNLTSLVRLYHVSGTSKSSFKVFFAGWLNVARAAGDNHAFSRFLPFVTRFEDSRLFQHARQVLLADRPFRDFAFQFPRPALHRSSGTTFPEQTFCGRRYRHISGKNRAARRDEHPLDPHGHRPES